VTFHDALRILRRRYWLVLLGAVVAAVVAAVLSFFWPPRYEAEAQLLIAKLRPSVTLDPRFETVTEENVVDLSVQEEQVRRQTLVALATNPDIVQQVADRLGGALSSEGLSWSDLVKAVDVGTDGNLITITANAEDPQTAAAIANAWASAFAVHVNRLYSATSPNDVQIQGQVEEALGAYDAANLALEAYIRTSQENELLRQIERKQQIISDLQEAHLTAAREQMDQLLERLNRTDRLVLDAQRLRAQLVSASPSDPLTPGESFALFSVEGLSHAQLEETAPTLELATGWQGDEPLAAGQAITHLDRVIETLETDSAKTQVELADLSRALLSGQELLTSDLDDRGAAGIAELQTTINDLQATLEQEQTQRTDLTNARDVARESYLTLLRKATEVRIASQLTGVEVQVASTALVPVDPTFPRPLLTIVLGLLAGALAGLVLAFLVELWPRGEARATG
jgi:capsular polysaccharide biosynthesis protein